MEEVFVPAVGMAMDNVILLEWLKNPGDSVNVGEAIAVIETDKTTMEIESESSGTLGKHRYQLNDERPAGATITVILIPGETE